MPYNEGIDAHSSGSYLPKLRVRPFIMCSLGLDSIIGHYASKGVGIGIRKILEVGGTIHQVGDFEMTGYIPWDCIEDALRIIRVSKLALRNPNPTFGGRLGTRTRARIA